ncbi:hypothetical protein MNBD_NITROSPINAE01-1353 [hydrothermal vent metagenome]|uniref:PilZ domain-containing protein n=1 Tax=hydrothermal vent metagenome TaxID=652676 RepID=A0A3B1BN92_9ZZZZ
MPSHTEKRKHPRIAKSFFVSIKKYGGAKTLKLAYTGIITNLSEGGMFLEMKDDSLAIGSKVNLSVCFDKDIVKISSQVLRLENLKKGRTGVGLKFIDLPDTGRKSIQRLQ